MGATDTFKKIAPQQVLQETKTLRQNLYQDKGSQALPIRSNRKICAQNTN